MYVCICLRIEYWNCLNGLYVCFIIERDEWGKKMKLYFPLFYYKQSITFASVTIYYHSLQSCHTYVSLEYLKWKKKKTKLRVHILYAEKEREREGDEER